METEEAEVDTIEDPEAWKTKANLDWLERHSIVAIKFENGQCIIDENPKFNRPIDQYYGPDSDQ